MKSLKKLLSSLLLPTIIVIAGVLLYLKIDKLPPSVSLTIDYIPYVVLAIGLLLSVRFNRSRIFFILTILFISLFIIVILPIFSKQVLNNTLNYPLILGLLIPLNLLIFSLFRERGFLTLWGILRSLFIIGQFIFIGWLKWTDNNQVIDYLFKDYIPVPFSTFLPPLILLAIGLLFILLLLKSYFLPIYSDGAFILSFISVIISVHLQDTKALLILFSSIGIILIISIIQDTYRMSYMDELTGLPARRALKEDMMKLSGMYTVSMLDIDFFKKFNDKHGHDIGDEVLKMVATCLSQVTGGGKAFRYGGEEFTILFPGKELEDAIPHLESLRETIAKRAFILRSKSRPKTKPKTTKQSTTTEKKLYVTISIGVANKEKNTKTPQEVMKKADIALYRAKKKGRNCVSK